mgnify:CR=1 FL=1
MRRRHRVGRVCAAGVNRCARETRERRDGGMDVPVLRRAKCQRASSDLGRRELSLFVRFVVICGGLLYNCFYLVSTLLLNQVSGQLFRSCSRLPPGSFPVQAA